MSVPPVLVTPRDADEVRLWGAILELSTALPRRGWTVIGAQMVVLHAAAAGRELGRSSGDLDLLADVRLLGDATRTLAASLIALGFSPEFTIDGRAHRFRRGDDLVDLLAPDGLGARANLETVPGGRTVVVPGGSQALRRTVRGPVEVAGLGTGELLGAILLKARAVEVADDPAKHRRDLAYLLSYVSDPSALRAELSSAERGKLQARAELLDPDHPAYQGIGQREDAAGALRLLLQA
jgi:hypothetical protein